MQSEESNDTRFRQGATAAVAVIGLVSIIVQVFGRGFAAFLILISAGVFVFLVVNHIRIKRDNALSQIRINEFKQCMIKASDNHYLYHSGSVDYLEMDNARNDNDSAENSVFQNIENKASNSLSKQDTIKSEYMSGVSKNELCRRHFGSKNGKVLDQLNQIINS